MLQEDSNGETTFEIIDKKTEDIPPLIDRREINSSTSSSASLLPSPGISLTSVPSSSGNLFSNVAPPSALPSFVPTSVPSTKTGIVSLDAQMAQPISMQPTAEPYYPTQFSAAIPPNRGIEQEIPQPSQSFDDKGGLLGWMKSAVSSGGILSKVAEKAKNSVDSMITTLDPQMREYIYSGGDLDILVASNQEVKISPIREAFQEIFGKATVNGVLVQASNVAAQPVGFAAGVKAAEERIQAVFQLGNMQPIPVVAIENFLFEVGEDRWYDLGVLLLNDPIRQIVIQVFTQMTPVPTPVVTLASEDTPSNYPLKWSGYSVTIGSLMGKNLGVSHTDWHKALTGVSRRDIILLAAKSLATMYKSNITQG